ncbi:MAG: type II CAAX endopeptidase family protein [Pseudomonadota bacterium]
MQEMTMRAEMPEFPVPTRLRGALEVLTVVLLLPVGGIVGGLTGFVPAAAIMSVLLPLIAATLFLRREGLAWRELVFGRRLSFLAIFGFTLLALAGGLGLEMVAGLSMHALGLPEADISAFSRLVEGNLGMYLWMLIPVAWGSAAIGEELLVRGFMQHRLTGMTGPLLGAFLQALIFGLAHFYQGITGIVTTFAIGFAFGLVYLRSRNLLPLIVAHGLIDTFAMTALYLGHPELLSF